MHSRRNIKALPLQSSRVEHKILHVHAARLCLMLFVSNLRSTIDCFFGRSDQQPNGSQYQSVTRQANCYTVYGTSLRSRFVQHRTHPSITQTTTWTLQQVQNSQQGTMLDGLLQSGSESQTPDPAASRPATYAFVIAPGARARLPHNQKLHAFVVNCYTKVKATYKQLQAHTGLHEQW